jgi:hypothetical protein
LVASALNALHSNVAECITAGGEDDQAHRAAAAVAKTATAATEMSRRLIMPQLSRKADSSQAWAGMPVAFRVSRGVNMATTKKSPRPRKYGKAASTKVAAAMHERKEGTLRSGRSGKKVTSPKQAIAIGLAEARRAGAKVPKRQAGR